MNLQECRRLNHYRKTRKRLNITQADVAKVIGKTPQYVSALERGLNELSYNDAYLISRYFGMSPDALFLNDAYERISKEKELWKQLDEENLHRKREEFEKMFQKHSKSAIEEKDLSQIK